MKELKKLSSFLFLAALIIRVIVICFVNHAMLQNVSVLFFMFSIYLLMAVFLMSFCQDLKRRLLK